jgi:serine phosphatase RsbU (regulator of sigma subunit)
MDLVTSSGELLSTLDAASPAALAAVLADFLGRHADATQVGLWLVDYDIDVLHRVDPAGGDDAVASAPLDQGPGGRAFTAQTLVTVSADPGTKVYLPVSVRAERLGVLEVVLPGDVQADLVQALGDVAITVAYVLRAASASSDVFERTRRRRPLSLAAEMQWGILQVRAASGTMFSVAGQLVPAYDVGGDNFYYAIGRSSISIGVTDAMGHGLRASMLTALTINALRCARRGGRTLIQQAAFADSALFEQFGGNQFVTAMLMEIDLTSGRIEVVNAGHPHPYRLRNGVVEHVRFEPQLPLGLFETTRYQIQAAALEAGDRLLLVSDGVLESTNRSAQEFGEERLEGAFLAASRGDPHEAVRALVRSLREWQHGPLRDDATVLCLDWHGDWHGGQESVRAR